MKNSYFENKPRLYYLLGAIAVLSLVARLLFEYQFDSSALLYVGIPFLTSLILIHFRDPKEEPHWKRRYKNWIIDAFIIMLGSSIVLFEGFVCVVMFMPIYLLIIFFMFSINVWDNRAKKRNRGTFNIQLIPLLILVSAFEGVNPELSIDRNEQVTVTQIVQSDIATIKRNLKQPIELQKSRPWFLKLFPMPYRIDAGSLTAGDVHQIHFEYYRWFFTNLHKGRMLLEISEVDENRIKTTFLEDTSYIASYLRLKGTLIQLEKLDDKNSRVTLTINFDRKLDPYWYFGPVERYGIKKTAEFLISDVIARNSS